MKPAVSTSGDAAPANDTDAPANLPVGGTFETNTWRVHRFADSVRFTHLANAGVRGKKCMEIAITTSNGRDLEALDLLVAALLECVALDPSPETFAALAKDAPLVAESLSTHVSMIRGVDVELGVIKIDSDLVRGRFSTTEFSVTVTAIHSSPKGGGFRQDSHLYNADKRSVPKAYRWARENAARIGSMTRSQIYEELRNVGVRVSTWD